MKPGSAVAASAGGLDGERVGQTNEYTYLVIILLFAVHKRHFGGRMGRTWMFRARRVSAEIESRVGSGKLRCIILETFWHLLSICPPVHERDYAVRMASQLGLSTSLVTRTAYAYYTSLRLRPGWQNLGRTPSSRNVGL